MRPLAPRPAYRFVVKPRYSAFDHTPLELILRASRSSASCSPARRPRCASYRPRSRHESWASWSRCSQGPAPRSTTGSRGCRSSMSSAWSAFGSSAPSYFPRKNDHGEGGADQWGEVAWFSGFAFGCLRISRVQALSELRTSFKAKPVLQATSPSAPPRPADRVYPGEIASVSAPARPVTPRA